MKKRNESDLICTTCNKKGHTSQNCFENPANKGKVPERYNKLKNKHSEKATVAAESHKDASEITCVIIENMPKQKMAYVKFYDEDDSVEEVAKYKKEEKQEVRGMSMTFPNNQKVLDKI